MIKSTILLALSLFGFVAAPLTVHQNTAPKTITVPVQVISDGPAPISLELPSTVQTTAEVVISIPKGKTLPTAPTKEKNLMCGGLIPSQVGGSYRRCEWK